MSPSPFWKWCSASTISFSSPWPQNVWRRKSGARPASRACGWPWSCGSFTIKDLVLTAGGLFLLYKGASEIHSELEGPEDEESGFAEAAGARALPSFTAVVIEIGLINIVFSIDSAVTAIGMTSQLAVMAAAVIVSTLMMMFAARPVSAFIERRPTAKVLALAFILLVGTALVADGAGFHVPRGYLYFAMGFSLAVELLNGRRAKRRRRSKQGTNVVQSRNESA